MGVFTLNQAINPVDWLKQQNQKIKVGSRVFVRIAKVISPVTSPTCFRKAIPEPIQRYQPIKPEDVCVVHFINGAMRISYDMALIDKPLVTAKTPLQRHLQVALLDLESNCNVLCIDDLSAVEIDRLLSHVGFTDEKESAIAELLSLAKPFAAKESKANAAALSFMQGVYDAIKHKVSLKIPPCECLSQILIDYRCSIHGKEITESSLMHQDMQKKLESLVLLHCCKDTQQYWLDLVHQWNETKGNLNIDKIGVSINGQTSIYFTESDTCYRAVFTMDAYGKAYVGKKKEADSLDKTERYFIKVK